MSEIAVFLPNLVLHSEAGLTTDASTHHKLPVMAESFDCLHLVTFVWRTTARRGREPLDVTSKMALHALPAVRCGRELYLTRLALWTTAMAWLVLRQRKRWDAALVVDSGVPSFWFFLLCRVAGIPVALYLRGRAEVSVLNVDRNARGARRFLAGVLSRWYAWASRRMAASAPTVTDNDDVYRYLAARGCDVRLVVASLLRRADIALAPPEPSVQPAPLRICSVGRVVRLKGLHVLLHALGQLRRAGISFTAEIVGQGDAGYLQSLREQVQRLDLDGHVHFLGAVQHGPELYRVLRRAEVFVLPSLTEGTPKTVVEAMSQGLVVVASSVGGLPRLLESGRCGLLVPPDDAVALAHALRHLATSPETRARLADAALAHAQELTMHVQLPVLVAAIHAARGRRAAALATPRSPERYRG